MAEEYVAEEIVNLLKEKYLFHNIHQNFLTIEDVGLVGIYLRLLTVYDEVNTLVYDEENIQMPHNLRHIIRCLRSLGLSYLAPNPKELVDKKKAIRIISALHDKISSKYGNSLCQRVRHIIKKEQMSKTCSLLRKPVNQLEEQTAQSKFEDFALNRDENQDPNDITEYPKLPFERIIPKGRQIPRTPLKIEENNAYGLEEKCKKPAPLIFPSVVPPPLLFEDSPVKKGNMNSNSDRQAAAEYLLTPPSEFCDSSTDDNTKSLESSCTVTPVSDSENGSCVSALSEQPSTMSSKRITYCVNKEPEDSDVRYSSSKTSLIENGNCVAAPSEKSSTMSSKRLTYCINKESEDSGISYSSSETSLIEENYSLANENAICTKNNIEYIGTCVVNKLNENICCISACEESRIQSEVGKTISDIEPSRRNAALGNRLSTDNKRRTYCIPKIPSIPEKIEEDLSKNFEDDDSFDSKNKRRTHVVRCNSKPCRVEQITEGSMKEYQGDENPFDGKDKRRTFVIHQDSEKCSSPKESDSNEIRREVNKTIEDLVTTDHTSVSYLSVGKKSRLQDETGKIIYNNIEPSVGNVALEDQLTIDNKRRTYCIPHIPSIPEKIEEDGSKNFEEEDNFDSKNKRRTHVIRPCRAEHITKGNMKECQGEENPFDGKDKRRTFVIEQNSKKFNSLKESNSTEELNETIDDLDTTALSKALYIDILKNDISIIDRGKFPRGRELSRTPPSLNSSFDPFHQIEKLDKIGARNSMGSINKFVTIPESEAVSDVCCPDTELEKCIQDTTYAINSKDSSYNFEDSLELFPHKKEKDEKILNHISNERTAYNIEKETDEDIKNKVSQTTKSRVAQVDSILSVKNEDFDTERTKEVKTRKVVSKVACKVKRGTSKVYSNIKQVEAKGVEENILTHNETLEKKTAFKSNQDLEDIESKAPSDTEFAFSDDIERKDKRKGTRVTRKAKKENNLMKEKDEMIKSQFLTLDSGDCKSKLSPKKSQDEERVELKKDKEVADLHTRKKRGAKPKVREDNMKDLKELEMNMNSIVYVEDKAHAQKNEKPQVLEKEESELNESEGIFLKPNSEITKRLTECKRRVKKTNSSNNGTATEPENSISIRPVRSKRTPKNYIDQEAENVEKQDSVFISNLESGNGDFSVPSTTETAKIKNVLQRKSSRNKIKPADSPQEKELEEKTVPEKDIDILKNVSNIEKTIQKEKPVRKKSSKIAMIIEKFDNMEKNKEANSRTRTKLRKNSENDADKETLEHVESNVKESEKDIKLVRKIKSRSTPETEDNEENDVNDKITKERKGDIKLKAKGRQKKNSVYEDKENQGNIMVASEDDQIIRSKSKSRQRKIKDETEYKNENSKPKSNSNINKKLLVESINENKMIKNESKENHRPSRKCKSYAKLAITDMLNSTSE